jgi:starch-binding outer membrane protein, SusD/RagB family
MKIMNTHKLYFTLLAAVGLALGSCSKSFVDKTPLGSLPTGAALDSSTLLQSDLNGLYAELRNVDQYGRDFLILGDLMADNIWLQARNSGRYVPQWEYNTPVSDATALAMWSESYQGILDANQIIDATATGADAIKAQAYALRALLYFKLVNIYAGPYTSDSTGLGVPLVLHYNVNALPARATVAQVYAQIVSDLQTALQSTPTYQSSVFLSNYAVEGLLARVFMYMGDYNDAYNLATDVINNSPFTLVTPQTLPAFWANPGVQTDAVEVMFEIDCDPVNNNGPDDLGGFYNHGYQDVYCSSDLYALYSATDARGLLLVGGLTAAGVNAIVVNKYPNALNTDKDNLKVIRLAEVYLIAAESANRLGNDSKAQTWLNALMAQRDPVFPGYTDIGPTLLSEIVTERRKELAFEGDRFYDLQRLGLAVNRVSNNGSDPAGDGLSVPFGYFERLMPMPQQELLRNPNIQQNPGY